MEGNVMSFGVAIKKGFEPGLYSYDPKKIPLGEYAAVLNFKIWSKRIMAINCYFMKTQTGEKFVVTVYCNYKTGRYNAADLLVNFAECTIDVIYLIRVEKNNKGGIILIKAEAVTFSSMKQE